MPLPDGVTTCTVTLSKPINAAGEEGIWVDVKIVPDRRLVHVASGWTLFETGILGVPAEDTGAIAVDLPHVDQAGFCDKAGASVTGWSYTATGSAKFGGTKKSINKPFQVADGLPTLDLDLIPDKGAISVPAATAPTVGVVSVAGIVGPSVDAEALAGALEEYIGGFDDAAAQAEFEGALT